MRSQVKVAREGEGGALALHLTLPQRELVSAILDVQGTVTGISDERYLIQFGVPRNEIRTLSARVASGETVGSIREMSTVYCALRDVDMLFDSEEAFYTRTGFFREHARRLAKSILAAIDESS